MTDHRTSSNHVQSHPICVGCGLVALDYVVVENGDCRPFYQAGGSCGNVMAILAFLGWEAYPLARLHDDRAADLIEKDLSRIGVRTPYLLRDPRGTSPVIIHRINRSDDGRAWHRFELRCPVCRKYLPRYRPLPARDLAQLCPPLPEARAYYFDRVTRANADLAKHFKEHGALVFLEPPSIPENTKLFLECLKFVDIIKYAEGKYSTQIQAATDRHPVPLEIVTKGQQGLAYRVTKDVGRSDWSTLPGFDLPQVLDAAGAGDWCSAGLINYLTRRSPDLGNILTEEALVPALSEAQAFAALNCLYPGARGMMHALPADELLELKNMLLHGSLKTLPSAKWLPPHMTPMEICPSCAKPWPIA